MCIKIIKPIALAALFATLTLSSVSAYAWECVFCARETTAQAILQAVNDARDRIVNAIQGSAVSQSTATSESAKIMAESTAKTAADMKKLDVQIKAEPLDPCGVTAAAKGGSAAAVNRPGGGGRGGGGGGGGSGSASSPPTAGATQDMQKVLAISSGAAPAPAPEIAAAMAAKGACGTFAKDGLRAEACRNAGFSASASSGYPDADIHAETLFDGPQTAADRAQGVNRKLTIKSGNFPERTAVEAFIRNLETPIDLRALGPTEINSEAGRNYMALRDSYDAAMSLATKPVRDQQSLITANKTTLPILKQLAKSEDSRFVTTKLDSSFPSWRSDGISFAQLMQLEADRRYLNEDWHVRMAGANEKQLLAEQVQLQAFNGWLNVSMLERLQQQAIIQGTAAGAAIRSEKMPQLIAAHRAAKR